MAQAHELLERRLVEIVFGLLILVAGFVHELKRARHHEPSPLLDTAGQMKVNGHIPVNVVKTLPVRVVNIDGHLPCRPPIRDVLSRQSIGSAMYVHDDALKLSPAFRLGKIQLSVWSLQYHGIILLRAEVLKEFVEYAHRITNYDGAGAPSGK